MTSRQMLVILPIVRRNQSGDFDLRHKIITPISYPYTRPQNTCGISYIPHNERHLFRIEKSQLPLKGGVIHPPVTHERRTEQ